MLCHRWLRPSGLPCFPAGWLCRLPPGCSPQAASSLQAARPPCPAQAAQAAFMAQLWRDSVGFMGAFMIRRVVGIAHVAELKSIADADIRSALCCHFAGFLEVL